MSTHHRWVTVLAGGDGRRLSPLTRDSGGRHVPKQFCRFANDRTLLERTLIRAERLVPPENVLVVVQEAHRPWWEPVLRRYDPHNVLIQTSNRGTAVAVFRAVTQTLEIDRDPHLLVLPSDHEVDDEPAWHGVLQRAFDASARSPFQVVMVGVEPQDDPNYGWLLPGALALDGTHSVVAFVEKPGAATAAELARRGALCSTFVFAAFAGTLLELFDSGALGPLTLWGDGLERASVAHGHRAHTGWDFSRDVLQHVPGSMRVLPAPRCGWTDLGTPDRLTRWLGLHESPVGPDQQPDRLLLTA